MFERRIRALIDRHCLLLRDATGELGKMLAQCDPYAEPVDPAVLERARRACSAVGGRGGAIGIPRIERWARELERALAELEARDHIEPWDMVHVMALQGELAAAVDEIEADRSQLYASCTTAEALEVAPLRLKPAF